MADTKLWKIWVLDFNDEGELIFEKKVVKFDEKFLPVDIDEEHLAQDMSEYLILPTFADLHLHIPQWQFTGIGSGTLLNWLNTYTFPAEKLFEDKTIAYTTARSLLSKLLQTGTTAAVTFVSIHKSAVEEAFYAAKDLNFSLFAGKVLMDQNAPDFLLEDTYKAIEEAAELSEKFGRQHVITPRFAITCSEKLMEKAAFLARKYNLIIQTHMDENVDEIKTTESMYGKPYYKVYEETGLLTPNTLLAHCIHTPKQALETLAKYSSKIVHCPSSNMFLKSGLFNFKTSSNFTTVFIGSDIAGGPNPTMWHTLQQAVYVNKLISQSNEELEVSITELFKSATYKAFEFLGLNEGRIKENFKANFQLVDLRPFEIQLSTLEKLGKLTSQNVLQLLIMNYPLSNPKTFIKGHPLEKA